MSSRRAARPAILITPSVPVPLNMDLIFHVGSADITSMECPMCGSDDLFFPDPKIKDALWLLILRRPMECFPCREVFAVSLSALFLEKLRGLAAVRIRIVVRVKLSATGAHASHPPTQAPA